MVHLIVPTTVVNTPWKALYWINKTEWRAGTMQRADLSNAYNIVPVLHSVLFHFTHQVTSGYSISLIRDPARGSHQFYLLHFLLHSNSFSYWIKVYHKSINPPGVISNTFDWWALQMWPSPGLRKKKTSFCICILFVYVTPWQPDPQKSCPP